MVRHWFIGSLLVALLFLGGCIIVPAPAPHWHGHPHGHWHGHPHHPGPWYR